MYVLGINTSHDQSVALVKDGKVLFAIAEERLDRIKHSTGRLYKNHGELGPKNLPWRGIAYCLNAAKIGLDDLDQIVIDRCLAPVNREVFARQIPLKDPSKIRSLPSPSHHLAHAASTFYTSDFEEAAILIMDHVGSLVTPTHKESESFFIGKGVKIEFLHRRCTSGRDLEQGAESPANFYRLVTLALGFATYNLNFGQRGKWLAQYNDAGKTMGLAPYGRHRPDWAPWVTKNSSGEISYQNLTEFLRSQGVLRPSENCPGAQGLGLTLDEFVPRKKTEEISQFFKDLAFKAQEELERAVLFMTEALYQKTGLQNLCLAGGLSLNSVANKKILDQGYFKKIHIQSAATDDGNAIGAALYGYFNFLQGKNRQPMKRVYLGREYTPREIEAALKSRSCHWYKKYNDFERLCKHVATYLADGKVVAWFQGGSEFGPRALGNRSILADPRNEGMRDYLNGKIKFREKFRPFAPAVLRESSQEFFEFEGESPFMLMVAPIRVEKLKLIPAVDHVDHSARLQTVTKEDNPRFYGLIEAFHQLTGIPLLLNTSLNIKGEPIAETPEDVLNHFLNSEIDILVMGDYLLSQEIYPEEILLELKPLKVVRTELDNAEPPHSFLFAGEKINPLSKVEFEILNRCDGKTSVKDLIEQFSEEKSEILKYFLKYIRNQWVIVLEGFRGK